MITVESLYKIATIKRIQQCAEARDNFVKYCRLKDNAFYTDDRPHLLKLCQTLDDFYKGLLIRKNGKAYRKLMINILASISAFERPFIDIRSLFFNICEYLI